MEKDLIRLSNKTIIILLLIVPVACFLALILSSLIIPGAEWPPSPIMIVATLIGPMVMVGFMIYSANFRDERTIYVSDKASRNGFMFVILVMPVLLIPLSLSNTPPEAIFALLFVWFGAVIVASISAAYYYRK